MMSALFAMKLIFCLGGNPQRLDTAIPLAESIPDSFLLSSSELPVDTVVNKLQQSTIPPKQYLIDYTAWDTVTNFTNTQRLVKSLSPTEIIVVTDGYHMLRALTVASIVYWGSGIKITPHESSRGRHEGWGLILLDAARAALYRLTSNTLFDQEIYNDRIGNYYNAYAQGKTLTDRISP